MVSVYINYPSSQLTLHADAGCPYIRAHAKQGQRHRTVTAGTLATFLKDLVEGEIAFASTAALNDLWLDIRLDTPEAEQALVEVVHEALGQRYTRLACAKVKTHCP